MQDARNAFTQEIELVPVIGITVEILKVIEVPVYRTAPVRNNAPANDN